MARRAEGWRLDVDPRTGIHRVRFTHGARRHKISTAERDPAAAARKAAAIYAQVISGRRPEVAKTATGESFVDVAAGWLADENDKLKRGAALPRF
jgi:hypothetical protein